MGDVLGEIFISYATEDRDRVEPLARAFESRHWSVWWDRKIVTGQTYDQIIERALADARCVVVLWSSHSVRSEWVRNEATVAMERGLLLPATLDPVSPPLEFRRRQTANLNDWDGDPAHPGYRALCDGVAAALELEAPSHVPTIDKGSRPARRAWMSRVEAGVAAVRAQPAVMLAGVLALVGIAYYAGARGAGGSRPAEPPAAASSSVAVPGSDSPAPSTVRPLVTAGRPSAIDLLSSENGGQLLLAPGAAWAVVVDGKTDSYDSVRVGEAAVFGFKDDAAATFDTFEMLIPSSGRNPKEFELLAGDESPTGAFRRIGTFHPENNRVFKRDGWQEFRFPPVTARYLKVRLISNFEEVVWIQLVEFRLMSAA